MSHRSKKRNCISSILYVGLLFISVLGANLVLESCLSKTISAPKTKAKPSENIAPAEKVTQESKNEKLAQENKSIVQEALKNLFDSSNINVAHTYLAPNYIQHKGNTTIDIKRVKKYLENIRSFTITRTILRTAAYEDFVAVHSKISYNTNAYVAVDIFQLENQKIITHWSLLQALLSEKQTYSGNSMIDSVSTQTNSVSRTVTAKNKESITTLFKDVFYNAKTDIFITMLADDFVQHDPNLPDGKEQFASILKIGAIKEELLQVVAENDIVFALTKNNINNAEYGHVIRMNEQSQIVEYWTVYGE